MAAKNEAQIWGVMAASGSGKGLWIKEQLRRMKPRRLVIWDYKDEYSEHAPDLARSLVPSQQAMVKARRGPLQIRYKCKPGTNVKQTRAEFEALCRLVQAWGNCVFLAEELSNVTTPSWAPAAWREMTTGGRHEAVHIIGVAQNPALIDKTFLSNCSMVHVGPLRQHTHRQAVARAMDIPLQEITALEKFHYIQRHYDTKSVVRGRVYPPGEAPRARQARATATGTADGGQRAGAPAEIAPLQPTNQPESST